MSLANSHLGRYQPLRQFGSGGTGAMYLAQDTHMPRQVAVKVVSLDDALQRSNTVTQRVENLFHDEMQALAQLDHPHILPVFDFGQGEIDESIYFYLAMEYCPAGSLAGWLPQAAPANAHLPLSTIPN